MTTLKVIKTGSKGNGYILNSNDKVLLLEAGASFFDCKKALSFDIRGIQGGLLTHRHADHCGKIGEYIQSGIRFFSNPETCDFVESETTEQITSVPEKKWFSVGDFNAVPFYVEHDGTPNYAYVIDFPANEGRMLFATDFSYLPFTFKKWAINFWLIECNHCNELSNSTEAKYEHSIRGHSSLETCKDIVKANKTPAMRNIVLCHLSKEWGDSARMKEEIQRISGNEVHVDVAAAGKEIPLRLYPWEN